MRRLFESRYKRFTDIVDAPLSKYFGCNHLNILVKKGDQEVYITIKYQKKYAPIQFNLPPELNELIHSFRGDYVEIYAKLVCPKMFPFASPIWELIRVKSNLYNRGIIRMDEYYQSIVELTNESNIERNNWSCIYGFEKEASPLRKFASN